MSKRFGDQHEVQCVILRETDKAFRLESYGNPPEWFPKSQVDWVEPDSILQSGSNTTFYIPTWLMDEKGWI